MGFALALTLAGCDGGYYVDCNNPYNYNTPTCRQRRDYYYPSNPYPYDNTPSTPSNGGSWDGGWGSSSSSSGSSSDNYNSGGSDWGSSSGSGSDWGSSSSSGSDWGSSGSSSSGSDWGSSSSSSGSSSDNYSDDISAAWSRVKSEFFSLFSDASPADGK